MKPSVRRVKPLPSFSRSAAALSLLQVLVLVTAGSAPTRADVSQPSILADFESSQASLNPASNRRSSGDGRFVVFDSELSDLVSEADTNRSRDVFLLDRQSDEITLVSRSAIAASAANSDSFGAVISNDGDWVAFYSLASDLIPQFVDGTSFDAHEVYLWSRSSRQVTLVSHVPADAAQSGNGRVTIEDALQISDDGRFVAFTSQASDMVPNQVDSLLSNDIFLFDRTGSVSGRKSLISGRLGSSQTAAGGSTEPALAGDGEWVAFTSTAPDLTSLSNPSFRGAVYRWERARAGSSFAMTLLSHRSGDPTRAGNGRAGNARVSRDGSRILFESTSNDLVLPSNDAAGTMDTFLWRGPNDIVLVSHVLGQPRTAGGSDPETAVLSTDASSAVFQSSSPNLLGPTGIDNNLGADLFHYEVATGTVTLISHAAGQPLTTADGASRNPEIDERGSIVVFESEATNLTGASDANLQADVFSWQRTSGSLTLLSHRVGQPGTTAERGSSAPSINSQGTLTVFQSRATDLAPGASAGLVAHDGSTPTLLVQHPPFRFRWAPTRPIRILDEGARELSEDGRYLVFESPSDRLVPGQRSDGTTTNIFLFDHNTGRIVLVSRAHGLPTTGGSGRSFAPRISADGSRIVFLSEAGNLFSQAVVTSHPQVYLYDVPTRTMTLVTHRFSSPRSPGNGPSLEAQISADGSHIAIESQAGDLVPGTDLNFNGSDIFLYEIDRDTMLRVTNSSFGSSDEPTISDSGEFLAFTSSAPDLANQDNNIGPDVFLFDASTLTIRLISHQHSMPGTAGNSFSNAPSISGDGSRVAFQSISSDLTQAVDQNNRPDVFVFERLSGVARLVSHADGNTNRTAAGSSLRPVISRNGRFIAFGSDAPDLESPPHPSFFDDIFRYDLVTNTSLRVSRGAFGALPNGSSTHPRISDDGDRIVFTSRALNNLPFLTDLNSMPDAYLFTVSAMSTELLSSRFDRTGTSDGESAHANISGDGSMAVFSSTGTDLMTMVERFDSDPALASVYLYEPATGAVDLGLTLTPTNAVTAPGSTVRFELAVANRSPTPARRTTAVLAWPRGSNVIRSSGANGWFCEGNGNVAICRRKDPLLGFDDSLFVDVTLPATGGPWNVRAAVKSLVRDGFPGDNSTEVSVASPPLDFGDAPSPYPTLESQAGALHALGGALRLGSSVDAEANGQPSVNAIGDDTLGLDDEDGVSFPQTLQIGAMSSVNVDASAPGRLDAWIDWNRDGDWDDPGEKVFDALPVTAGSQALLLTVPISAVPGTTFSRFRLSSAGAPLPTGAAVDGEVEDHALTLAP